MLNHFSKFLRYKKLLENTTVLSAYHKLLMISPFGDVLTKFSASNSSRISSLYTVNNKRDNVPSGCLGEYYSLFIVSFNLDFEQLVPVEVD